MCCVPEIWLLCCTCLPSFSLARSEIDPDNSTHEPNARRLFEAMLIALQEVGVAHLVCGLSPDVVSFSPS